MKKIIKKINKITETIKEYTTNPFHMARYIYTKYYEKLKINENQILLESFMGLNFNGNPYYLLLELSRNPQYNKYYKYVAVTKKKYESVKKFIDSLKLEKVEVIVRHGKEYCKLLAQAKYLINNVSFPEYFIKKEGQIYLNTWHGTPLKGLGKNIEDAPNSIGNGQRNFIMSDYLLYPNYYTFEIMKRDYMIEQFFTGKYLLAGYPRNDIFYKEEEANIVREKLNIQDKKVIVYMPTWRGKEKGKKHNKHFFYILHALFELEKKLDEDTIVYVKLHHLTGGNINFNDFKKIRKFPEEYETYEFLNIADGLITDYSSVMFDFANTGRKIMLYSYDKEEYMNGRSMYFDINELPFPSHENFDDIINEIKNIDKYESYDEFKKKYCEFDNEESSKIICDYIFNNKESEKIKVIDGTKYRNNKKNVLMYVGELTKNGVTTALKGIINNIDLNEYNYILTFLKDKTDESTYEINELKEKVEYIPIQGQKNKTLIEALCEYLYYKFNINTKFIQNVLNRIDSREAKRLFSNIKFESVIHYNGYGRRIMHLFRNIDAKKIIYTHNDLKKEKIFKLNRSAHMNSLKMAYKEFDKIVVIRESMINEIKENVKNIDESKICVAHNINNVDSIIKKSLEEVRFEEDTYSNYNIEEIKNIIEDNNKLKFINIARYSKEKGLERLISAFEKFRKTNENAYLIIIGGYGNNFKQIKDMVINNKINNVILIRSLRNPYPILKKCNAYILSSFFEGLPMTIMEALILKKPVISTKIAGPKEFLEQGYGYLVENSEEGILNGMIEYQKGNLNNLKEFNAEEFNKKAIQEFYDILKNV